MVGGSGGGELSRSAPGKYTERKNNEIHFGERDTGALSHSWIYLFINISFWIFFLNKRINKHKPMTHKWKIKVNIPFIHAPKQ